MKRFPALQFLTLGMWLLFAPTAQAQVPQPAGPLRIVDSTGKSMGSLIDLIPAIHGVEGATIMRAGGLRFMVLVAENRLFDLTSNSTLFFLSTNCQGQQYILSPLEPGLVDFVAINGVRSSLYGPAPGGTPAARTTNSQLDADGNCAAVTETLRTVEAARVLDLRDYFTPPYMLQEVAPLTAASVPMLGWPELVILSLLIVIVLGILRMNGRDTHDA